MRSMSLLCACVCVLVAVCHAAPAPAPAPAHETLDVAESAAIEPQNDKEVIEIINLSNFGQSDRDKRDINMLRQLFPGLAQVLDRLIQELISQSFRVIGRVVLQNAGSLGGLLGGGAGGGDEDGEGRSRVSVSLPTFPPDEDDEDEDEDDDDAGSTSSTTTISNTVAKRDVSSQAEGDQSDDNSLHGSESQNAEVRVKFDSDQDVAASNGGPSPAEEPLDGDDADRNKRFLPFGVGLGSGGGDHGGAAGGSGNFLFDIIRLVAGSGSGSGASEAGDAGANAPEVDVAKGADGYTEGVPGPITRLFVIANRGIANLIQDLILRLAQTSERIVNFKARLVTALI